MKKLILPILFYYSLIHSNSVTTLEADNTIKALNFIKKYLPIDPIILEAGAFDGRDTIHMAKLWPKSKIYAFEPVPNIFNILSKNTKKYRNIYKYQIGLSDFDGTAIFHVSNKLNQSDVFLGASSLLAPTEHIKLAPSVNFSKKIKINVLTLDSWASQNNISNIDFMWLDMQGSELSMLKKSKNVLKKVKIIYLEVIFINAYKGQPLYQDIKKWFDNNNFKLIALDFDESLSKNPKLIKKGKRFWGNAIFINKKFFKN